MPREAKKRLRLHQRGKGSDRSPRDGKEDSDNEDDEDDEDEEEIDRLTAADAYVFPIMGSVVLFGLYLAFQYLPKDLINRIIGGYMALMGVGATARMFVKIVQVNVSDQRWKGFPVVRSRCGKRCCLLPSTRPQSSRRKRPLNVMVWPR